MLNEIGCYPLHPSNFIPEWELNQEGGRDQTDTFQRLRHLDQSTPTGKKKRTTDTNSGKTILNQKKQQHNHMDVK